MNFRLQKIRKQGVPIGDLGSFSATGCSDELVRGPYFIAAHLGF
jgi:hypothetical protein